jgi:phosphoenolpyruvate carboxykinase (GTP)
MRPFIGYNVCEYFQHWIDFMKKLNVPPQFYLVNWFRKDEDDKFIWNGFSENSKILKWIFLQKQEQQEQNTNMDEQSSAFGKHPSLSDLYLNHYDECKWKQLFSCKPEEITDFKMRVTDFFNELEKNSPVGVPRELKEQLDKLC